MTMPATEITKPLFVTLFRRHKQLQGLLLNPFYSLPKKLTFHHGSISSKLTKNFVWTSKIENGFVVSQSGWSRNIKVYFLFFFFIFFVCWGGDFSLALCSPPSSYWTHKPPAAHQTPFAILILKQTTHNPKHTTQHKHTTHDTTHNTYGTKHNPKSYLTLVIFSALFMFHGFLLPPLLPFSLRFSERKTSSSVRIYIFLPNIFPWKTGKETI